MKNLEEFNGRFSGKTCFIVGAGPSLCDQDLAPLRDHVVIAVNSGYIAVPWAPFFISDDWSVAHWSYFFRDLRQSPYTRALLYEDKLAKTASWFGDRAVLFRHRKGIHIPDAYEHDNPKNHIGQTRTSVGSAIMVAHIMGCSTIALLGIDGHRKKGLRYFWQMNSSYQKPYRNDGVPVDKYKIYRMHGQTNDYDLLEMAPTWDKFGKAVNKKCKVYNCSEDSVITVFPKKSMEELLNES